MEASLYDLGKVVGLCARGYERGGTEGGRTAELRLM